MGVVSDLMYCSIVSAGQGSGKGKGKRGCHDLMCGETMVWVWFVILVMVLTSFVIIGITGRGRVDIVDEENIGGGPWWAWMIGKKKQYT